MFLLHTAESGQVWSEFMIDLYTVSISWWDVFDSLSSPVWFIRQWLFLVNYSNAIFF